MRVLAGLLRVRREQLDEVPYRSNVQVRTASAVIVIIPIIIPIRVLERYEGTTVQRYFALGEKWRVIANNK